MIFIALEFYKFANVMKICKEFLRFPFFLVRSNVCTHLFLSVAMPQQIFLLLMPVEQIFHCVEYLLTKYIANKPTDLPKDH